MCLTKTLKFPVLLLTMFKQVTGTHLLVEEMKLNCCIISQQLLESCNAGQKSL